jgi:hypothetical protein
MREVVEILVKAMLRQDREVGGANFRQMPRKFERAP